MFKRLFSAFRKPVEDNRWPNPLPQHRWNVAYVASVNGSYYYGSFQQSKTSNDHQARDFKQDSIDFAINRAKDNMTKHTGEPVKTSQIVILSISYLGWTTDAQNNNDC